MEIDMSKKNKRGNREPRKPKQAKAKPQAADSIAQVMQLTSGAPDLFGQPAAPRPSLRRSPGPLRSQARRACSPQPAARGPCNGTERPLLASAGRGFLVGQCLCCGQTGRRLGRARPINR